MSTHPCVHVLLVNFNRWSDTIECLESVFRLDYPNVRVVVCDNGSADGSLGRLMAWAEGQLTPPAVENERLQHLSSPPVPKPLAYREYDRYDAERGGNPTDEAQLIVIRSRENLGFTGGVNVGLRYVVARGECGYVWLLNNDTVVAADALTRLVERAMADETVGVVGARVYDYDTPDRVQATGGGKVPRWHGMGQVLTDDGGNAERHGRRLDYVTGTSMLVPMNVLAQVGLLDERYFAYAEDVDWCLRLKALGYRFAYSPDAMVWHKEGKTTGRRSPFHDYLLVRNALLLTRKFSAPLVPLAFLYSLYRSFLPKLVRGQWARLAAVWRAYGDFLAGSYGESGRHATSEPALIPATPGQSKVS